MYVEEIFIFIYVQIVRICINIARLWQGLAIYKGVIKEETTG